MATFAINPATDTRKFTKILTLTHIFASIEQHHNTNAKVTMWKNWWNFLQLQIYSFAFVRGWAFSGSGQVQTQPDIVDLQSLSPKNPNIQFGSGSGGSGLGYIVWPTLQVLQPTASSVKKLKKKWLLSHVIAFPFSSALCIFCLFFCLAAPAEFWTPNVEVE